jgi:Fe2+ or Zn2+ uptake regulation protein
LANFGKRPVLLELAEYFSQNKNSHLTLKEVSGILCAQGHKHVLASIRNNLEILTSQGFLLYEESQEKFSLNLNPKPYTLPEQKSRGLRLAKRNRLKNGSCDRCHKHFKLGEKPFIKQYGILRICLCMDCFQRKPIVCQV